MKNIKTNENKNIIKHGENTKENIFSRHIRDTGDDRIHQLKHEQASILIKTNDEK